MSRNRVDLEISQDELALLLIRHPCPGNLPPLIDISHWVPQFLDIVRRELLYVGQL